MGGATESEPEKIKLKDACLILTNNPMVAETLSERFVIEFLPWASDREVLCRARDRVHLGHRLLTAPLAGSVKPWETPYRSVMISSQALSQVDYFSLVNMEQALAAINPTKESLQTGESVDDRDFQLVDLSLIESALPSLEIAGPI
jgi:hypothetical protein